MCVWTPRGAILVAGGPEGRREPFAALAAAGKGRVVLFGHNGFLTSRSLAIADSGRLLEQSLRWASGPGAESPRIGIRRNSDLAAWLRGRGFEIDALDDADWTTRLPAVRALVWNPDDAPDATLDAVRSFIAAGGGFVAGATGWGWRQLHGDAPIHAYAGNRLLAPFGMGWSSNTVSAGKDALFATAPAPGELLNAAVALHRLSERRDAPAPKDAMQMALTLEIALGAVPPDDRFLLPGALDLAGRETVIPKPREPVRAEDALARLRLMLATRMTFGLPPAGRTAHPSAAVFPGAVPADAPPIRRTFRLEAGRTGWISTGLYAPPGTLIEATIDPGAAALDLSLRIGAHRDHLWHLEAWRRAPEITIEEPLIAPTTGHANPWGGPIYIVVPGKPSGKKPPAPATIAISGAVEAPFYEAGRTDPAEWRSRIRKAPAPWAELAGRRVILTVPSRVVRSLDDPEALLAFWDAFADACADLAAVPRERPRPERYVLDEQISAGYMHSGYPIMAHLDVAEVAVDLARLRKGDSVWGFFHEMGHNHQSGDWTFGGTGEVTCNLFALYGLEIVCGVRESGHGGFTPASIDERIRKHFGAKADFEAWKKDPFLALVMYEQLRRAFGWEAFRRVFREYRGLDATERPRTDETKRDQWLVRFSRAVGRNLGPFFDGWGIPVSAEARAAVAALPAWMP